MESTAAIGRLIRAGMKEVNTLDAIIHNKYARRPRQTARLGKRQPHRARPETREETRRRSGRGGVIFIS